MKTLWLDDALLGQYKYAFPIIKKYKSKVIIAVPTGLIGKDFLWTNPYANIPCMNIEQLKEMIDWGCEIASHGVTHKNLKSMPKDEFIKELEGSKKWIIENLGVEPQYYVPPYDDIYPEQEKIAKKYYTHIRKINREEGDICAHIFEGDNEGILSNCYGEWCFLHNKCELIYKLAEWEGRIKPTENKLKNNWFSLTDIKKIPNMKTEIKLPEGYKARFARGDKNGKIIKEDAEVWISLHSKGLTPSGQPTKEYFSTIPTPESPYGIVFIDYKNTSVGSVILTRFSKEEIESGHFPPPPMPFIEGKFAGFHHSVVRDDHRKKGLYGALMTMIFMLFVSDGYEYFYVAPNDYLWNWYNREIFQKELFKK